MTEWFKASVCYTNTHFLCRGFGFLFFNFEQFMLDVPFYLRKRLKLVLFYPSTKVLYIYLVTLRMYSMDDVLDEVEKRLEYTMDFIYDIEILHFLQVVFILFVALTSFGGTCIFWQCLLVLSRID